MNTRIRTALVLLALLGAVSSTGCESLFGKDPGSRGRSSDDDIVVPDLDAEDDLGLDASDTSVDDAVSDTADVGPDGGDASDIGDLAADASPGDDADAAAGDDADALGDIVAEPDLDAYEPGPLEDRTRLFVCGRWNNDRTFEVSEGWTAADGPACDPGIMTEGAEDEALTLIGLYHWLVGLNAVAITSDESRDAAIACATLLNDVDEITDDPDDTSACYSTEAHDAVRASVARADAATPTDAVDAAMHQVDDISFIARRTLLDTTDHTVYGIGQVGDTVCTYVSDSASGNETDFVAYPNPGFAPMLEETPWTLIGGALRFDVGTTVQVVRLSDGQTLRTGVRLLTSPPGNGTLIVSPDGWEFEETYEVRVSGARRDGVREDLRYRTTPTTCAEE